MPRLHPRALTLSGQVAWRVCLEELPLRAPGVAAEKGGVRGREGGDTRICCVPTNLLVSTSWPRVEGRLCTCQAWWRFVHGASLQESLPRHQPVIKQEKAVVSRVKARLVQPVMQIWITSGTAEQLPGSPAQIRCTRLLCTHVWGVLQAPPSPHDSNVQPSFIRTEPEESWRKWLSGLGEGCLQEKAFQEGRLAGVRKSGGKTLHSLWGSYWGIYSIKKLFYFF